MRTKKPARLRNMENKLHTPHLVLGALAALAGFWAVETAPAQTAGFKTEQHTFSFLPGDTLVIQNDYGRVQVRAHPGSSEVRVRVRAIAADERNLPNVAVVAQKTGNKIHLHSYFYNFSAESVYLEVEAPAAANAIVWGANPAVEIHGLSGYVRAHTLTGLITAENLTSAVSLLSERGDIVYRAGIQPEGDVHLESIHGTVHGEMEEGLNLRGWLRAGGRLSWNQEVELSQGALERHVGRGGPLFLASSLNGNVQLRFVSQVQAALLASPPASERAEASSRRDIETTDGSPVFPGGEDSPASHGPTPVFSGGAAAEPSSLPASDGGTLDTGFSLRVDVDFIYLNVSVRDARNNRTAPNLRKEDFLVHENGVQQTIERFSSEELPYSLLLLLDVSGSTAGFMDLMKTASIDFTRQISPRDQIAVAVFNSRVRLVQNFTSDRQEVAESINRIRAGGGTAFYDALHTGVREYMKGTEGRKAVVVFTDGVDNQLTGDWGNGSRTTFEELYREVQESESLIYTIFLDSEGDMYSRAPQRGPRRGGGTLGDILGDILRGGRTPPIIPGGGSRGYRSVYEEARRQLEMIAEQTGGRMYSPEKIEDLRHVYSEVADDLRIQYLLGYVSTNPAKDGTWREIQVQIRDRSGLVARTRRGYYADAPPERERREARRVSGE